MFDDAFKSHGNDLPTAWQCNAFPHVAMELLNDCNGLLDISFMFGLGQNILFHALQS